MSGYAVVDRSPSAARPTFYVVSPDGRDIAVFDEAHVARSYAADLNDEPFALLSHRGRTYKSVGVYGIGRLDDAEVLALALRAASETETSLFGARIVRSGGTAVVTIYTD